MLGGGDGEVGVGGKEVTLGVEETSFGMGGGECERVLGFVK